MPLFSRHSKRPSSPEPQPPDIQHRARSFSVSPRTRKPGNLEGSGSKGYSPRDTHFVQSDAVHKHGEHHDPHLSSRYHPPPKATYRQCSRRGSTGQNGHQHYSQATASRHPIDRAASLSTPRDARGGAGGRDYALIADPSPSPDAIQSALMQVRSIRSIETEPDRLACGQGPIMPVDRLRPLSSTTTPRTLPAAPEAQCRTVLQSGLGEDEDIGARARAQADSLCARDLPSFNAYSSVHPSLSVPMTLSSDRLPEEYDSGPSVMFRVLEPRQVLRSLNRLLRGQGQCLQDYIEVEELLEDKAREESDGEARLKWLASLQEDGSQNSDGRDVKFRVFGASLQEATTYASTTTVLCGYQHDLPTVIYACIEELYRTGIYQQGLFRALPNRTRLLKLVDSFNRAPPPVSTSPYETPSVRQESMPNICALLSTYLDALPEALLNRTFHNALWSWCVRPSLAREEERRVRDEDNEDDSAYSQPKRRRKRAQSDSSAKSPPSPHNKTPEELRKQELDAERPQIAIAQHIFRLLPRENFSLLVYLCAFFTQVPLCPDNGIVFEDIARIFGHRLLGGPSKNAARVLMVWLLNRWGRITEGLFELDGDAAPTKKAADFAASAPGHGVEERNRRASYPAESVDRHRARETSPEQRHLYAEFERAVHWQMQDNLGLPSRRPYSSFSSDGSSSTFASTTGSEFSDFPGCPSQRSAGSTRKGADNQDQFAGIGKELKPSRAISIVEDFDAIPSAGHPRPDDMIEAPYLHSYGEGIVPSDYAFGENGDEPIADTESVYSTDSASHEGTHESDERSGVVSQDERHPSNPSSGVVDSKSLPADLSVTNHELSSARQRIAQLERELELARAQALEREEGSKVVGEAEDPRSRKGSSLSKTRVETEGTAHSEARKQLQAALSERDDARRIMLDLKKVIEGALER